MGPRGLSGLATKKDIFYRKLPKTTTIELFSQSSAATFMLATLISLDFGGELEPGIKFDQIENWIRRCNKLPAGNPITPAREMLSGKRRIVSYPIHSFFQFGIFAS